MVTLLMSMMIIACNQFAGREIKLENGYKLSVISTDAYRVDVDENVSTIILLPEEYNIPVTYEIIEYGKACDILEKYDFERTNNAYVTILLDEEGEKLIYLRPFLARDSNEFDATAEYWFYFDQQINSNNGFDRSTLLMSKDYNNNIFDLVLSLVVEEKE